MRLHFAIFLPTAFAAVLLFCGTSWAETAAPTGEEKPSLSLFQAAVLGVVEGTTEYLPVSSTGHLLLVQRWLGMSGDEESESRSAADAFAIVIQAGAILAVLGLFRRRFRGMALGLAGKDKDGLLMLRNVLIAFIPAAVLGFLLEHKVKEYLYGPLPIAGALFVGGIAIFAAAAWRRNKPEGISLEEMGLRAAIIIGIAQSIAICPGVSRSLATILGGLAAGLTLGAAVEFSFLLGFVTLAAATGYETMKEGSRILGAYGWISPVVGFVVAFLTAIVAVKWMVSYLQSHGLAVFGVYRIALAVAIVTLVVMGLL